MKRVILPVFLLLSTWLGAQTIVINEVDADNPDLDTKEFIELKTSTANMALDGYVVVLFNGYDDKSYEAFDLDGYKSDAKGLFVIGSSEVSPTPDYVFSIADIVVQNGPDAVAIYQADASNFPNDTPISLTNLIDVLVYDTDDADDPGLLSGFNVTTQYNEGAANNTQSNQRKPDGTFEAKEPTPGELNYGDSVTIVINEVDADNPGIDTKEFIELKTSRANIALDGYVVVLFNGSDDQSYEAFDLDGYSSDNNGLFVLGTSGVCPTPDYVFSKADNVIQNGPDAVAIYQSDASNFPNDTPIDTTNLIDVLVYDTDDDDDSSLLSGFNVTTQYNEGEATDKVNHSNQRKPDGTFEAKNPTPGAGDDITSITISTPDTMYTEGETINITFTASKNLTSDLVLNYTLSNENFENSDFTGSLSATIVNGTSMINTEINLVDDPDAEGIETLIVKFYCLDPGFQVVNDKYEVYILDNEEYPWGPPLSPTFGLVNSTAPDYYSGLAGMKCQELKEAITALISDSSVVRAQTYGDVWDILKKADLNPLNLNEVWLIYGEKGRSVLDQHGTGSGVGKWNREHIYPTSRGDFKDGTSDSADGPDVYMNTDATHTEHAYSDAHGIRPADFSENTSRSNNDYGEDYNGSEGNKGSWKGDVARSVLYMALRYNALDVVSGNPDNSTVGQLGDLDSLLLWHVTDQPDDYEMNRNNVIFEWQKNRNPFIDHPEYVELIWNLEEEYISLCQGEEYNGWTESGKYHRTLISSSGCDSIVITHLTVNPVYESEENVSIWQGESYYGLTEEGDYRREFETISGCDSVIITHLTVLCNINISGYIKTDEDEGIEGVILTFSNDGGTTQTDANGFYSKTVNCGWSGTITPEKECYSFLPEFDPYTDISEDLTDKDYTASLDTITVSGHVRTLVGGYDVADVTLIFSNGIWIDSVQTNSAGNYELSICSSSGTITITPKKAPINVFDPPKKEIDDLDSSWTADFIITDAFQFESGDKPHLEIFPNPFNKNTKISFFINENYCNVNLMIFDNYGKIVTTILDEKLNRGSYDIEWKGINTNEIPVTTGIYFCRLIAGNEQCVKKMILLENPDF